MPGRKFDAGSGYRYGFNGKEKSDEVYGEGNIYDYGFRIYNPRIGKFLSVDPLTKEYPWYTPYQYAGNKPVRFTDRDGAEEEDPFEKINAPSTFAEITAGIWNNSVDAVGNLFLLHEESKISITYFEILGKTMEREGIKPEGEIDPFLLMSTFQVRKRDRKFVLEFKAGLLEDLKDLGISVLDVAAVFSPGKPEFALLEKASKATVLGQISNMLKTLNKGTLNNNALKLLQTVRRFENKIFQIGRSGNLMLDKAGLTHILGRHHPAFKISADKAVQSMFSSSTKISDIVATIEGITKKYSNDIEKLMNNAKSGKGETSKIFEYNGKKYQLGIDPTNSNRIGQFFEQN